MVIILKGGTYVPSYNRDRNVFYFEQENNFYYLINIRETNLLFILDGQRKEGNLFYNNHQVEEKKVRVNAPLLENIEKNMELNILKKRFRKDIIKGKYEKN